MTKYTNGNVPRSELVKLGSGTNAQGYWEILLPKSTALKVKKLQAWTKKKYGKDLLITPGWNGYRSYAVQVKTKAYFTSIGQPGMAATPRTSSHGGTFKAKVTGYVMKDVAAVDFYNWYSIFKSTKKWYAAVKKFGLTPGAISKPEFAYTEEWHVIDLDPYAPLPKPAAVFIPKNNQKEDEDMLKFAYEEKGKATEYWISGLDDVKQITQAEASSISHATVKGGKWGPDQPVFVRVTKGQRDKIVAGAQARRTRANEAGANATVKAIAAAQKSA